MLRIFHALDKDGNARLSQRELAPFQVYLGVTGGEGTACEEFGGILDMYDAREPGITLDIFAPWLRTTRKRNCSPWRAFLRRGASTGI